MTTVYTGFCVLLALSLAGGLARIAAGPSELDLLLAAQLLGTTGVAILLVLTEALGRSELRDVALLFAVLAALNVVAFVRQRAAASRSAGSRS